MTELDNTILYTMSDCGSLSDSSSCEKDLANELSNKDQFGSDPNKPKRHIACELCRRRKLKCNGVKPSCDTCTRLKKACQYTAVHKKSGPQRGYLKKLESRLEQLEQLLAKTKPEAVSNNYVTAEEPTITPSCGNTLLSSKKQSTSSAEQSYSVPNTAGNTAKIPKQPYLSTAEDELLSEIKSPHSNKDPEAVKEAARRAMSIPGTRMDMFGFDKPVNDNSTELMPLNVEEPYPCEEVITQLVTEFFSSTQPCFHFLHKNRFQSMLSLGKIKPHLLYSVLLTGASFSDNHLFHLQDQMYKRAVKYIFKTENFGYGEEMVNLQYVQSLVLIAIHENRIGSFGRAWLTVGKAIRAANQNNLHEIELLVNVRECFNMHVSFDPFNTYDIDERRRTFWTVYVLDKYCAMGSGWPTGIKLNEIKTHLPLDDDLFHASVPESVVPLEKVIASPETYLKGSNSSFALSVVFAYFLGESLTISTKARRADDNSPTGEWWKSEESLSRQLNSLVPILPKLHMNAPDEAPDDNPACLQLFFHTAILGINRSAVLKLREQNGPYSTREFNLRCQKATCNIVQILRMFQNLFKTISSNPCVIFCLYTAARSFITILEEEHSFKDVENGSLLDEANSRILFIQLRSQLDFLITVMKVLRPRMFMAECFYEKLQADIRRAKLSTPNEQAKSCDSFISKMQSENEIAAQAVSISLETDGTNPRFEIHKTPDEALAQSISTTPDSWFDSSMNPSDQFDDSPASLNESLSSKSSTGGFVNNLGPSSRTKKRKLSKSSETGKSTGQENSSSSNKVNSGPTSRWPRFNIKNSLFEVKGVGSPEDGSTSMPTNLSSGVKPPPVSFSPAAEMGATHSKHLPNMPVQLSAPDLSSGVEFSEIRINETVNISQSKPSNNTMADYDNLTNNLRRHGAPVLNDFPATGSTNNSGGTAGGLDHAAALNVGDFSSILDMPDLLQWNSALSLDDIIQRVTS